MVEIVRSPIDAAQVTEKVLRPGAGALVTFDGVVRDHSRGKPVDHLFYECYEAMAIKEMKRIREEALKRWPLCEVGITHRIGRLEISESSVLIVVSSAHRKDAFEACRYVIDNLKTRVPIWKKEVYSDGEIWVEEQAAG